MTNVMFRKLLEQFPDRAQINFIERKREYNEVMDIEMNDDIGTETQFKIWIEIGNRPDG